MERKIKVNASSGYYHKNPPSLLLKGKYLTDFGFPIDTSVSVKLNDNQIVITPITENKTEK